MGDAAIGNVYGSNIANLALVGGLASLIRPLQIQKKTLLREIPVMIMVALLLWPVLHNLSLSRLEGVGLLGVFVALILLTVYRARKEAKDKSITDRIDSCLCRNGIKKSVVFVAIGLVGLALGANLAVQGAKFIGEQIGLSDAVIGLTILAVGTSLPELVTCVVAAVKGHHDISIGNLVGSNIFNTLLVVGVAGVVRPLELVAPGLAGWPDYWIMIIVSAGFTGLVISGRRSVSRAGGLILLCGYLAYITYLFFHPAGS